ncbi:MAG: deoxynucleoside kinase [Clostridia bacterium]|nr:deoxynucleoside kinase [Clostridia bacterium]
MAVLISIDGLDGSGKGTQSDILCERLNALGKRAKVLSFPMYEKPSCFAVEMYLGGGLGGNPSDTNAYAASTFFAVDRYISYRTEWKKDTEEYDYIIFNRYVSANAVHQLSKLPREEWESFLSWLWDYEFEKLGLPKPDMTIYLLVPPEVSMGLVDKRGAKKDIHELDGEYMQKCFEAGKYAADRLGFVKIDCCDGGSLRTIESIADEIQEKVKKL